MDKLGWNSCYMNEGMSVFFFYCGSFVGMMEKITTGLIISSKLYRMKTRGSTNTNRDSDFINSPRNQRPERVLLLFLNATHVVTVKAFSYFMYYKKVVKYLN